jgi:putative heme-binding domain-containing protein
MKAIGVRPSRGDLGLPDARIIRPGDPYASTLYFRMAKFGRDRMPHLGSERPDEAALGLIERWITLMDGGEESPRQAPANGPIGQDLTSPASALPLARGLGRGELNPAQREAVLAAAAQLPSGPIRDLFAGYFPSGGEPRGRKLGSNPRPNSILALDGDPARGEALFWSEATRCGACHRIGDRGTPVGPDLSTIGRLRSRPELLESVLEPSRRVEPKYASYLAVTTDGITSTGLLAGRDERWVVLRDGQGRETKLAAGEVEELRPARGSLMPEGQLAELSAQEAADLIEYLASRK